MVYQFTGLILFLSFLLFVIYFVVTKLRRSQRLNEHLKSKLDQEEEWSECLRRENWRLKSNFEIGLEEFRSLTVKYNMLEKSIPVKNKKSSKRK